MADEGTPPEPPRFPPVDENPGPPSWPPDYSPPPFGPPGEPPPYGYGGYGPPPGNDWYGNRTPYGNRPRHWLHPLDLGRAFSAAWRLYRFNWRPLLGAMLAVYLPLTLVGAVIGLLLGPEVLEWFTTYSLAVRSRDLSNVPLPPTSLWIFVVFAVVSLAIGLIATSAVIKGIDVAYRGGRPRTISLLQPALAKLPTLIAAGILLFLGLIAVTVVGLLGFLVLAFLGYAIGGANLGVFLGLIGVVAFFVAFLFFSIRWSFFAQAVMCEDYGPMAALGRSWRLVAGSGWRVFGYGFMAGLVVGLIGLVFSFILVIVDAAMVGPTQPGTIPSLSFNNPLYALISGFLGIVPTLLTTPWYLAVLTLLYFDLRWQKGEAPAAQVAEVPA